MVKKALNLLKRKPGGTEEVENKSENYGPELAPNLLL
jgi:hypothetical protein